MAAPGDCKVCDALQPQELVELDLLLADPLRWPKTVWGLFDAPKIGTDGMLPPSYRRFGAMEMGGQWLKANGYDISRWNLRKHFANHVPVIHVNVDELVSRGLIKIDHQSKAGSQDLIEPGNFLKFYSLGVDIGVKGLEMLQKRIDGMIERGEEVPLALIKQIVDTGAKLAMSQAQLRTRGHAFEEEDDENDGFRGAADVSPRFGSYRVRTVEGESRPVFDEGPTDRKRYNERAKQEGSPELGGQ